MATAESSFEAHEVDLHGHRAVYRVAGSGLDPDVVVRSLTEKTAISHTVERNTSGQADPLEAGLLVGRVRHPHHDLFARVLHGASEVHLAL